MASILLIHGVMSSHTTWWRLEPDLVELGWQVHAIDLLGHGGRTSTDPPTLDGLAHDAMEQTGAEHVDLILGHSLGAVVGLALAALEPGFATGLLLEDPPGLGTAPDAGQVADSVEQAVTRALADPEAEQDLILQGNPLWPATDAANAVANRRLVDVPAVTAFLRSGGWDLPQLVADCPVPTQLLAARGPATALGEPDRAAVIAALPADRVREYDCGHGMHRDRPALWLDTVTRFATALGIAPSGG